MEAAEISATPMDALQPGDQLGRYQLLCPIARGGMGQVWAARQAGRLGLPKLVAIKVALPQLTSSYETVQQFLYDEAQVAASIDHPNVCKILELGQEGGVLFIAMEWIHGAPLSTLIHAMPQRRFDARMAAHLVAQACSGLHAAHELRDDEGVPLEVVHRDATPHNLLVSAAGEIKVMDFGIVKSRNQQHQATQTGELKGKISYLAPEQIRGKGIDRRADVFTLGCVLYLATTGRSPFGSGDPGTTILRILEGDYASPSTLVPDYPEELEAIVARALAREVDDRYQTADELRLALEGFLSSFTPGVTREEVAALLHQYCGGKIEQRRGEIRAAQKLFDSQAGNVSSGTYPTGEVRSWASPTPVVPREPSIGAPETAAPVATSAPQTPAPQTPAPAHRRRKLAAAAVGVTALVAAAVFFWRAPSGAPSVPSAAAPGALATSSAGQAARAAQPIRISIRTEPADAVLRIDDGPALLAPHSFSVVPDGRAHVVHLSAPGHEESVQSIVFNESQSLVYELLPERTDGRASRGSRHTRAVRALAKTSSSSNAGANAIAAPPATADTAPRATPPQRAPSTDTQLRPRPRHTIDESDPFGDQP